MPASYAAQFGTPTAAEARWLAELPGRAAAFAERWSLRPDGAPRHGYVAVVWPVRLPDDTPAMLKLSWPHDEAVDEAMALATWAGNGAVRLLDHDDEQFALLLERLHADRCLHTEPIDIAVDVATGLLRRLTVPTTGPLHRTLAGEAARWAAKLPRQAAALGDPIPRALLDRAIAHCRELGPGSGTAMVNEDLHYFNVLGADREPWLLIDPKVIAGDPEFGVIPLLWNRYSATGGAAGVRARFDTIVRAAELDRDLATAWTLVRAVVNWLDALDDSTDFPDATALAEIAEHVAG